jgi:hypothetical protein
MENRALAQDVAEVLREPRDETALAVLALVAVEAR